MDAFVREFVSVPRCDDETRSVLDRPIVSAEIIRACNQLQTGKSCGADGIPLPILACFARCSLVITAMFNVVLENGEYPTRWIEGLITPILKPQKPSHLISSYRKVTVICDIGKLFEKVMENRLATFECVMDSNDPSNNGFAKGYRPADNLFVLDCVVRRYRFIKRPLYVALVDFSQAFDLVNRNGLFYKLIARQFGSTALNVIYSMYQKSRSGYRINGKFTEMIRTLLGVNQGSILSPRLFKKFFQDLDGWLRAPGAWLGERMLRYLLWADDLLLFATSVQDLQQQLRYLHEYCVRWAVTINTEKTKVLIFATIRGKRTPATPPPAFSLNGNPIEVVEEAIYLGIKINTVFTNHFKTHVDHALGKARKSLYRIYGMCRNFGCLPPRTAFKLFDSLVVSVLRYGSEVWYGSLSQSARKPFEVMHTKFLRYVLGIRRSTPLIAIYGETGRFPLDLSFRAAGVKYAIYLFRRTDLGQNSPLQWARGYSAATWEGGAPALSFLSTVCAVSSHQACDSILAASMSFARWRFAEHEAWQAQWKLDLQSDAHKLSTYKLFKFEMGIESYLVQVHNHTHRKSLSRFRMSSHNLAIERLRWANVPREQRTCRNDACAGIVEDEMHALLMCPTYAVDRAAFLVRISNSIAPPSEPPSPTCVMQSILNCQDTDTVRALACFVNRILACHAQAT
jgi:hypothetical protein